MDRRDQLQILHYRGHSNEHRLDKRFEDYASFQFMESGTLDLHYDDECFDLKKPSIWFHFPGPRIRFNDLRDRSWIHRYVAFNGGLWREWMEAGLIKERPIECPLSEVDWFASAFDEMTDLLARAHPEARVAAINTLETMILKVSSFERARGGDSRILAKLREVLQGSNYATPNYDLLASELGISAPTLRRRFREENGISIHAFVQRERVEKARTLIVESELKLAEISDFLGYSDIHYFTNHFSRHAGITPAKLRKSRI